jgi:uncharacterized protein YggE
MIMLACGGPNPARGQRVSIDAALTGKPYVQATGEATVSAKPDQAVIEIGVVTQASTATAAAAQNAKRTDEVLAELRKLLGESDQLKDNELFGSAQLPVSETRSGGGNRGVQCDKRRGGHPQ